MTDIESHRVLGMACDAHGCEASLMPPDVPDSNPFESRDYLRDLAVHLGWSIWVGRGRRHYCPAHGPKPGHKMRHVAGRTGGAS